MNSLFYSCPDLITFQTLKFASDETNTEYFTYNSSTVFFGTPDVKWDQICFVFDTQYPLIYTKGKIIYDFSNIIQSINTKIGDLGNKIEAQDAIYYTQEEANSYNTTYGLNSGDSSYITTETIKTPAVEAVPYNNIVEMIIDDEEVIAASLNDLNSRLTVVNSLIGTLGNKVEAKEAVYYTQEEANSYNGRYGLEQGDSSYITTETIKTPAVEAVPYNNIIEIIIDNEKIISGALNDFDDRLSVIGTLGNKVEAQEAIYYTQEEANAYNEIYGLQLGDSSYVTTQTLLNPAVEAVPYTTIMEVINDHKLMNVLNLNELSFNKEDRSNKTFIISYNSTDTQYPSAKAVYSYVGNAGFLTLSNLTGKENSSNKVTSITSSSTDTQYPSAKAVYSYVGIAMANIPTGSDSSKEDIVNKVTSIDENSTDTQYPSAKAVYSYINNAGFLTSTDITGKENSSNKVTSIDENSTDTEYPSAKAVYSYINNAGFLTSTDITGKENSSNKVTSINENSTDIQYPSAKAVYSYIGEAMANVPTGNDTSKENISNKVTYIDANSTNDQYPSAYAVHSYVSNVINNLLNSSESSLAALNQLAEELGNDSSATSQILNSLGSKEDTSNKVTSINENSTNTQYPSAAAVYSYVGTAMANIPTGSDSSKEDVVNKVTSIDENSTDTEYPSAAAVYSYINNAGFLTSTDITGKENSSNKVTSIDENSTDTEYPSAKAVYSYIGEAMANVPKIWIGTQLQYDAIIDKDSSTIYIIQ